MTKKNFRNEYCILSDESVFLIFFDSKTKRALHGLMNDLAESDPKACQEFLASQHKAYMESSEETDAKRKDEQVQEISYSEQKEEQQALETTFVKPRKEVEDKICFGFQCKYRNWLKVKTVKPLQNINTNANANTNIKN
ncbi:hypothetical protein RFI_20582, partial [Reticulomyxa filosa]